MADGTIHQEFTSDIRQMQRDLSKLQTENRKLKESYAALQGKMNAFEKDGAKAMRGVAKETAALDKAGKSLADNTDGYFNQLITKAGLVAVAYQAVTAEITNLNEQARNAAQSTMTLAQAQQFALQNMGAVNRKQAEANFKTMKDIAKETGVKESSINIAYGNASAASGGNQPLTFSAVSAAAKWVPQDLEDMKEVATGIVTVNRSTRFKDQMADLGVLGAVNAEARISKPRDISKNASVAINSAVALGATVGEAAAIFSNFTLESGDATGEKSRTFMVQLAENAKNRIGIVERDPFTGKFPEGPSVHGEKYDKLIASWDNMTMGKRLSVMQSDPEMARAFFASVGDVDKSVRTGFEQFMTDPKSGIATEIAKDLAAMPKTEAEFVELGKKIIKQKEFAPTAATYTAEIAAEAALELIQTEDQLLATKGVLQEKLPKMLQSSGAPWLDIQLKEAQFSAETNFGDKDPRRAYADIINTKANEIEGNVSLARRLFLLPTGGGNAASIDDLRKSAIDNTLLSYSQDELTAEIKRLREVIKEGWERDISAEMAADKARGGPGSIGVILNPKSKQKWKRSREGKDAVEQLAIYESELEASTDPTTPPPIIMPTEHDPDLSLTHSYMAASIAQGRPRIRKIGAMNALMARTMANKRGRGAALMAEAETARAHRMSDTSDYQSSLRGERSDRNEEHRARIEGRPSPKAERDAAALAELVEQTRQSNVYLAKINDGLSKQKVASAALVGMNAAGMAG